MRWKLRARKINTRQSVVIVAETLREPPPPAPRRTVKANYFQPRLFHEMSLASRRMCRYVREKEKSMPAFHGGGETKD